MKFSPDSTDLDLVQGCLEGHRLAQKYLYQRYFGRMLGIAMRYTSNREEATEILNLAFLKVFDHLDQFRGTGALGGWIARIVFHTAIDHVRAQTSYRKTIDFNAEGELPVENDAIEQLAAEDLFKVIQKLPNASRTVFCLYVIDGFKHHEIAEQLGISEGTSKWHLSEARKELKKLLRNYLPVRETAYRHRNG